MLKSIALLAPLLLGGAYATGAFEPAPPQPAPVLAAQPAAPADPCPQLLNRLSERSFGALDASEADMSAARAEIRQLVQEMRSADCRLPLPDGGMGTIDQVFPPEAFGDGSRVSFEGGKPMLDLGN